MKKSLFVISLFLFLGVGLVARADSIGEKTTFYVDSSFDLYGRDKLTAVLVKVTPKAYFYVDKKWWDFAVQNKVYQVLSDLGDQFQNNIYPKLTSVFGTEWTPGIDNDPRIFILIEPMKGSAGGYFNSGNEYPKIQNPRSNEHEMVYLNSKYVTTNLEKSLLAHEFTHLITFYQKDKIYGVSEARWLNEARAEYAPTLAGYDDDYQNSNLKRRVDEFAGDPSNSPIEWDNQEDGYASANIFIHYLVSQYGLKILVDSLHSPKTGVASINYALKKNGYKVSFSKIFVDWTIASLINDCNYGERYCYKDKNLSNFHISPQINFLPMNGRSILSFTDTTKSWTGNWYKIVGGREDIAFSFTGGPGSSFSVPYILKKKNGSYIVNFLQLDKDKHGSITVNNFGKDDMALIIIPSTENVLPPDDKYYSFSWTISIKENQAESELIKSLLEKISELRSEINIVQAKIKEILNSKKQESSCQRIKDNLYYGMRNNNEVRCLQKFLKEQGKDIYPEGLITGNFFSLTRNAVIRFQEKFSQDILKPLGLSRGTGYVGLATLKKINKLLSLGDNRD